MKCSPAVGAAADPRPLRIDRLVTLGVAERLRDVRRQRHGAVRFAVQANPPAALAEMLEQLDCAVALACPQLACRARERLPDSCADRFEEQDLAARTLDRDPGRDDPRVVHHHQGVDQSGQLVKHMVRHLGGRAAIDEQPRPVPPRRGMLCDQLLRQVVVELPGLHPVRTVASTLMEEIREALRDGLREEAAPIARRLAEVKGLSNNVDPQAREDSSRRSTPSATRASTICLCSSTCSPKAGGA